LIQEKHGGFTGNWKIPGGHVDRNEMLKEAIIREVWEETGIKVEFKGIVAIKENTDYRYGNGD